MTKCDKLFEEATHNRYCYVPGVTLYEYHEYFYTTGMRSDLHRFASTDICRRQSFSAWLPALRAQILTTHNVGVKD